MPFGWKSNHFLSGKGDNLCVNDTFHKTIEFKMTGAISSFINTNWLFVHQLSCRKKVSISSVITHWGNHQVVLIRHFNKKKKKDSSSLTLTDNDSKQLNYNFCCRYSFVANVSGYVWNSSIHPVEKGKKNIKSSIIFLPTIFVIPFSVNKITVLKCLFFRLLFYFTEHFSF